jgi:excinuclease ABC subunit C
MEEKLVNKIKELPKTAGVYLYRDEKNRVIYVGKAVNLKNRVSSYFQSKNHDSKTIELVKNIRNLEWIEVEGEFEALVLEAELIKRYKPKYNIIWKDDKNYSYIKFTGEEYPRVSVVRQITDHNAEYIGPFIDASALRSILKLARHLYPYCTCSLPSDSVCLYYYIGLCPGHGAEYVSRNEYAKNLRGLKALFAGKTKKLELDFKKQMSMAAKEQNFELAANFRDKLSYLKRIRTINLFTDKEPSADTGLRILGESLGMSGTPTRIECYDISNILGTAAVGSMVVFKNGVATPKEYRRFKIKTVQGANDFASMAEVLKRRFSKYQGSKDSSFSALPDLVIVDGGKGQLSSVMALDNIPKSVMVISLAKKLEEIFIPIKAISPGDKSDYKIINLPKDSEGMFLVQRIRDEAHRFAITYHRGLKQKELFENGLDAIPGVGPLKKKQLIKAFGSIGNIREAKLENISDIVGVSLAKRIKELL